MSKKKPVPDGPTGTTVEEPIPEATLEEITGGKGDDDDE